MVRSIGAWLADHEAACAAVAFGAVLFGMCGVFFALLVRMWMSV
jgi:hypothetical protein